MQDVLSKPVELIDQDLDAVAGGFFNTNIADLFQDISQTNASSVVASLLTAVDQSNSAAQVVSVTQLS